MEGFEAADFRALASMPHQPGGSSEDPTHSGGTNTNGAPKGGGPGETKQEGSKQGTPQPTAATTVPTVSSSDPSATSVASAAEPGTSGTAVTNSHTPIIPTSSTGVAPSTPGTATAKVDVDPKQKPKLGSDKKAADANPDHRAAPSAT